MCCYDDLVDVCKPGDRFVDIILSTILPNLFRVEVTGIFRAVAVRSNPRRRAIKSLFKTYVDIVHVKRSDKKRLGLDASIVAENEFVVKYVFFKIRVYRDRFDEGDEIITDQVEDQDDFMTLSQEPGLYDLLAR